MWIYRPYSKMFSHLCSISQFQIFMSPFDNCKTSFYIKDIAFSQNMLGNYSYLNTKTNSGSWWLMHQPNKSKAVYSMIVHKAKTHLIEAHSPAPHTAAKVSLKCCLRSWCDTTNNQTDSLTRSRNEARKHWFPPQEASLTMKHYICSGRGITKSLPNDNCRILGPTGACDIDVRLKYTVCNVWM